MNYTSILSSITGIIAFAKAYLAGLEKSLERISPGTLYVRHDRGRIAFYEYMGRKKEKHLPLDSTRLYELLRRSYLEYMILHAKSYLNPLSVLESTLETCTEKFEKLFSDLQKSSVDLQRITLTEEQYKWAHSKFKQKAIKPDTQTYTTLSGVVMRSKSETIIGNILELLGIPYRYEAQLRVNVLPLVKQFEEDLRSRGLLTGSLYYPKGNYCYWNVPEEYQWMNSVGSIWRSFNYKDGHITIYPDFTIQLSDGRLLFIEHEGMAQDFRYRCNASERIFVLRQLEIATDETLICTFESDIRDEASLVRLFTERIMPKVFA